MFEVEQVAGSCFETLRKESVDNNGQQFLQFQQNEQSPTT